MKARRNTQQKSVIFDALRKLNCHASAGMVYAEIHKDYPTISRATVFRVLSDAAANGDLLRLQFTDADDRFDITTYPHYHVMCRRCGLVADVEANDTLTDLCNCLTDSAGFTVESHRLEFIGLCPACAAEESAENKESTADEYEAGGQPSGRPIPSGRATNGLPLNGQSPDKHEPLVT